MSILRHVAAWLVAGVTAATVSPVHTVQHLTNPYSCRSMHVGSYWFRGVESDACAGLLLTDGTFGGEAITGFDPDGRVNRASRRVRSCAVQLNRVVNGRAYPVSGARVTNSGGDPEYFDGRSCDAMGSWRPPRGFYNVTASYRTASGLTVTTVQGPVAFYPGGARG